jgi:predicted transcriptional regulator of viral defense system
MSDASDPLIYARELDDLHDTRFDHARAAARGEEHRVSRGVYLPSEAWGSASDTERYLMRVRGIANTRQSDPVYSFWSAAALHGLPVLGNWPDSVHVSVGRAGGGRSSGQLVRHVIPVEPHDVVEIDGLRVTSVARTVVDLASTRDVTSSIVAADRALHVGRWDKRLPMATRSQLHDVYVRRMPFHGSVRARRVIAAAVEKADSPLETVSRLNMAAVGLPRPVLQKRFDDYRGLIGFSEFYWPEFALVGEADGKAKYLDPRYRRGRTLERVLLDEKERADRLRAIGLDVSRWGWEIGSQPEALRRHFVAAGLPTGFRW